MSANIYYSPEAYGLTVVADIDKSSGCYEFDTFVVWKDASGRYYWAEDSGCSCPAPFEWVNLSTAKSGTLADAYNDARVWIGDAHPGYNESYWTQARAGVERLLGESLD